MIMPETLLRIQMRSESKEMRELRRYARSELSSEIGCMLAECKAKGEVARLSALASVARLLSLVF